MTTPSTGRVAPGRWTVVNTPETRDEPRVNNPRVGWSVVTSFVLPSAVTSSLDTGDTAWLLAATALVLLMAPGLALFYGGMVRSKSVLNMIMMTFGTLAVVSDPVGPGRLLARLRRRRRRRTARRSHPVRRPRRPPRSRVERRLDGAVDPVRGLPGPVLRDHRSPGLRCDRRPGPVRRLDGLRRPSGPSLVYAPIAHWIFDFSAGDHVGGWMANELEVIDFAGGTAVEISSGASALALALVLGRRIGFGKDPMRPHNLTLVMLGAGLLWFGWFGFNAGSALGANHDRGGRVHHHPAGRRAPARWAGSLSSGSATATPPPWVRPPAWSPAWWRSPRRAARSSPIGAMVDGRGRRRGLRARGRA